MSNETTNAVTKTASGLTKTHIILITGFAIVIGSIVAVYFLLRPTAQAASSGNLVVNESNLNSIGQDIADKVQKGTFETYMNVVWRFPSGQEASSNAVIGNAASNNYPFYFVVELADTGETVYTSGIIPVGMTLGELVLDTPLPQGEYTANCTYTFIDENDEEIGGDLSFEVTLKILN